MVSWDRVPSSLQTGKETPVPPATQCCCFQKGQGSGPHPSMGAILPFLAAVPGASALFCLRECRSLRSASADLERGPHVSTAPGVVGSAQHLASSWSRQWVSLWLWVFRWLHSLPLCPAVPRGEHPLMAEGHPELSPSPRRLPRAFSVTLPFKTNSLRGTWPNPPAH